MEMFVTEKNYCTHSGSNVGFLSSFQKDFPWSVLCATECPDAMSIHVLHNKRREICDDLQARG